MARTRSGRRLPPYSWYQTQVRSTDDVAANVPPTARQFQLAVDYNDEAEILAFFSLAPNNHANMAATNAFVAREGQLPPPRNINDDTAIDDYPHTWLWPHAHSRLFRPSSLLSSAACRGWERVLHWLFHERAIVNSLHAVLVHILPKLLADAASHRHVHTLELVLTSPLFTEELDLAAQQRALDNALRSTRNTAVCNFLVANGARVDGHGMTQNPLPWIVAHSAGLVDVGSEVVSQVVRDAREDDIIALMAGRPVVDHKVVLEALLVRDAGVLERVLVDICIDVDARVHDGETALLVCARADTTGTYRERDLARARCLLAFGADPTLCNGEGHSALTRAVGFSDEEFTTILLGHMNADTVHAERRALEIACARWSEYDTRSEHVLIALLTHGACVTASRQLLKTTSDAVTAVLSARSDCEFCEPTPSMAHRPKRQRSAR